METLRHFFPDNLIIGALDLIDRDRGAIFVHSLSDAIDRLACSGTLFDGIREPPTYRIRVWSCELRGVPASKR